MSELENRAELPPTGERVALMPIHPRYANAILDGTKGVEFRKRRLAPDIGRVFIYSTSPVSRVVGEFVIEETVVGSPEDIWQAYGHTGEISEPEFHKYFEGRDTAVALTVARTRRFTKPLALADLSPRPAVPQSTIYLAADAFAGR
jgi:predicted transcriptional regulator